MTSSEVGSYKTGCFFSEAMFGIPYESDFLLGVGRQGEDITVFGRIEGGPDGALRAATLLHETAHFVQDLSLGAPMARDYLLDAGLAVLFDAIRRRGAVVRLPLSRHRDQGLEDDHLQFVLEQQELADDLLEQRLAIGDVELSGRILLESLAAAQAARTLRDRCASDDDRRHLQEATLIHQLTPEQLGPPYDTVRAVFRAKFTGFSDAQGEQRWPWDITADSASLLTDVASALLADIACQIPPSEIIVGRIKAGQNTWVDFLPGPRFAWAVIAVREAGGFPDRDDFDQVYRETFDLVARRWGWPEWDETIGSWLAKVQSVKGFRKAAGDAYRYRLLVEKYKRPGRFSLGDPVVECFKQSIPVVYLTPNGLKLLMAVVEDPTLAPADYRTTTTLFPFEIEEGLTAWDWLTAKTSPWEDVLGPISTIEASRHVTERMPMLLQEIVSRTLSRAIHQAILQEEYFSCPFAQAGCDVAEPGCARLRKISDVPADRCALRSWLERQGIDPRTLVWEQN
jgi:hypothetical protein